MDIALYGLALYRVEVFEIFVVVKFKIIGGGGCFGVQFRDINGKSHRLSDIVKGTLKL